MNESVNSVNQTLSRVEALATEARLYSESMAMNMFQLGRVFVEAKELVAHTEWTGWLLKNSGMSVRSAQQMMGVYKRFADRPSFAGIDKSKLFRMLALPPGKEDEFIEENNLEEMTDRQVQEAVKRVREEARIQMDKLLTDAQVEIDRQHKEAEAIIAQEREARQLAEAKMKALEEAPPQMPPEVQAELHAKQAEVQRFKDEVDRLSTMAKELMDSQKDTEREKSSLRRELKEAEDMLVEKQREYDDLQNELLNAQSAIAKGDAEREIGDALTLDEFASAVRQFIGTVARMPHMGKYFSTAVEEERREFDVLLKTVESWTQGARDAVDTVKGEPFYV